MKTRKANAEERNVYVYQFDCIGDDHNAEKEKVIIRPGENGVSADDIRELHRLDDSEVYYNLKNSKDEDTGMWITSLDAMYEGKENLEVYQSEMNNPFYEVKNEKLCKLLSSMTEKQRKALLLVEVEEYSITEAAEIMGISISVTRRHLLKAKRYIEENYKIN